MAHIDYSPALIEAAKQLGVQLPSGEDYDPSDALATLGDELTSFAGDVKSDVRWQEHNSDRAFDALLEDLEDEPFEYADFGFSFKKLARGIGKGLKKGVKTVGKGVSAVGRNKVFQVVMPVAAISAHTTAKSMGAKPVFKGPLGKIIDAGAAGVTKKIPLGNAMGALGKSAAGVTKLLPATTAAAAIRRTANPRGILSFGVKANGNVKSAMASADKLLGSKNVNNAALVVRNTQALAALGNTAAKRGLAVLNATATIRQVKRVPPGRAAIPRVAAKTPVVQRTTIPQVKSLVQTAVATQAADAKNKTWIQKVLGWFGLEKKK